MRITFRKKGSLADILTKDFLYTEHYIKKKPLNKIAMDVGCDRGSVSNYLNIHKLAVQIHDIYHPFLKEHPRWKGYEEISMSYWKNVMTGAKNRGIPFELTIEEAWKVFISQNRTCALSGRLIGFEMPKSNTASIDRINSSKGYTVDNIQWVHRDVNFAKQSLSNEQFIQLCKEVVNYERK